MSDDPFQACAQAKKHLWHAQDGVKAARRVITDGGNLGHLRKELRKEVAALRVDVDQMLVLLRDREGAAEQQHAPGGVSRNAG